MVRPALVTLHCGPEAFCSVAPLGVFHTILVLRMNHFPLGKETSPIGTALEYAEVASKCHSSSICSHVFTRLPVVTLPRL